MPAALRVRLDPLQVSGSNQVLADGANVGFELLGTFSSGVQLDSPSPAKLTLNATLLSRIRGAAETESSVLASLSGELTRTREGVRFVGESDETDKPIGLVQADESDATDGAERGDEPSSVEQRVLRFTFRTDQFEKV